MVSKALCRFFAMTALAGAFCGAVAAEDEASAGGFSQHSLFGLREIPDEVIARCAIQFDVNVSGRAVRIRPYCTDSLYCEAAEHAMRRVEFRPHISNGIAVERINILYPIEIEANGVENLKKLSADLPMISCGTGPQS